MEQHTLTVMGDSIAAGLGDPVAGHPDLPWADQLAALLGMEPTTGLRNLGVVGARLRRIVERQVDVALRPPSTVTVVTGGGNDIWDPTVDWERLRSLLDDAVGRLSGAGSRVVTFGLFDITCTGLVPEADRAFVRDRIRRLNALTEEVTASHEACFVDFFDHPRQSAAMFSADGLHPNRRAHELIAREVCDALASATMAPIG